MRLFPKWIDCAGGPGRRALFVLITCLSCIMLISAQPGDKRIAATGRLARQINEQIAESERVEEGNGIYCNELVINKGDKSWPAVGIYRTVVKFYYTFGDREKNPYPNRLLKISVTTTRSNRQEYVEYIFNPAEQLIFYFEKLEASPAVENRLYFDSNRLIRRFSGGRNVSVSSRSSIVAARAVLGEQRKLRLMFANAPG